MADGLEGLIAQAERARAEQRRRREQRAITRRTASWQERAAGQLDLRDADDRAMDACEMRANTVRGSTQVQLMARCHLDHSHLSPSGLTRNPECVKTPGWCWLCGASLQSGRQRWCGQACVDRWFQNHAWNWASTARKRRDNHTCVRCGARPGYRCDCGEFFPERHDALSWREREDHRSANPGHRIAYVPVRLEVNHKIPREGRGYGPGCHHHQDGLETLCQPCHVKTTRAQRRARMAVRLAQRAREEQQTSLQLA